jgi:hypothetical protein
MSSWRASFGPALKSTINSQLAAATVANNAVSMDGPILPLSGDSTVASHFAAVMTAAQAALAALVGNATKIRVNVTGYRDTNTSAPHPGASASSLRIEVTEIF